MAGLIREEDIAQVRERADLAEIVGQYVTLKPAGGGALKGLCPFHDEKSPSFHVRPGKGFHCLAGESRVITWEGVRPIRDLAGSEHRILGADARWHWAPFRSYGVQRLWKLTLTRNRQVKVVHATEGHRWFVRAGKDRSGRREVVTTGLKPGDRLCYVYPRSRIRQNPPSPFGIAHGFTFGDGTRTRHRGTMALLCPPKDEAMLKWFPNSVTTAKGPNLLVHHLPGFFKGLPDLDESVSYLVGWLAGYFAADGCVARDGTVILNSASRSELEFARLLCTRLGIATYAITSQSRQGFPGREPSDLHRIHLVNDDLPADFFLIPEHRERFLSSEKAHARKGWVVQSVEESSREEEVFCAEVEQGHAFALEDNILTGNCFGCGEGGDVISFLMKHDGLAFNQAVEYLADKSGIQLRYTEGADRPRRERVPRQRLIEAHRRAQEWYAEHLTGSEAMTARSFLAERGFDRDAAERFGLGFAPRDGDALYKHLRQQGFSDEELVTGGLVASGHRGHYDRFRGRLLWPIREASGETIGFGARRIFDDDRIDAKYLNTPESPIYKKSQVLYGIDLARREIARSSQAVVVEGYTDVMACHLAGVGTAVATCGTAFGEDHGRVLRRLLHDHEEFRGEIIFTFDGDEAGQKAALKAFGGDQQFVSQTYVSVDPDGLDPCDLRMRSGDAAVRELVARRTPLYRFVLGNVVSRYDLDRADGRVDAVRAAATLVSSVRDRSKVEAFARELAGMVGVEIEDARAEVRRATRARPEPPRGRRDRSAPPPVQPEPGSPPPHPRWRRPTRGTPGSPSSARRSRSWCSSLRWPRWWSPTSATTTSPIPRTGRSGRRWPRWAGRPRHPPPRSGSTRSAGWWKNSRGRWC